MGVVIPHEAITAITESNNPKASIHALVGDLSRVIVPSDYVLLGIYFRPEKTKGGIIRPDANKEEDAWQGKVGLVLKLGPDAFRNTETGELYNQVFNVDDWVAFFPGDARQIQVRKMPCRLIKDTRIALGVPDPQIIF